MIMYRPVLRSLFGLYLTVYFFTNYIVAFGVLLVLAGVLSWFKCPQIAREKAESVLDFSNASVIAHKGAAGEAPENTIGAIYKAASNGARAIEFDVGYTSDGIAVLMHDDTVDRTTDGTGKLSELTWEAVSKLNATAKDKNGGHFPNETVPLLEDAVRTCLELDLKIYFDVKGDPEQSAKTIPSLYEKYPALYNNAMVCSFYPNVIYKVRQADPEIVTALTWRPNFISRTDIHGPLRDAAPWTKFGMIAADVLLRWLHFTWLPVVMGNSAFLVHKDIISREMVRDFNERNIQVVAWTVNDNLEKSFIKDSLKVPVITDFVKE